jgi:hypothetical protein
MVTESRNREEGRQAAVDAESAWQRQPISLRVIESGNVPATELDRVAHGRTLLGLQDFFCRVAEIDPDTANAAPLPASEALRRVAARLLEAPDRRPDPIDASLLIAAWAAESIDQICREPRHRMRRQHAVLGLPKVREVDVRGLRWLTQRPGATVREKLAHARRMLCVVRPWVPDTHENRVVCRVIGDVRNILARRGTGMVRHDDVGRLGDSVEAGLESLRHICRDGFERSPLAKVLPAMRLTPNNVLLGDRDYRRAWKLANWLRSREEYFETLWARGTEVLAAAVMLAVEASLWRRADTHVVGTWVRVTPGGRDACSVDALTGGRQWLCNLHETSALAISIVQSGAGIEFRCWPIESPGSTVATPKYSSVRLEFRGSDVEHAAGTTFACTMMSGERVDSSPAFSVPGGLAECATWIAEKLGVSGEPRGQMPRFGSLWMQPSSVSPPKGLHAALGADLFGAGVRIASLPCGRVDICGPAVAARWIIHGIERWVTGDEAASAPRANAACSTHAIRRLLPVTTEDLPREGALRTVFNTVASHAVPAAEWAVAIPDEFDEMDCQVVRSALPATAGTTTLIWRSVATALRWRATDTISVVEDGDQFVVVDGEATGLAPVPLVARFEENGKASEERLYWERASVVEAPPSGREATSSTWLAARARAAVTRSLPARMQSQGWGDDDVESVAREICDRDLWQAGNWCWVEAAADAEPHTWHRVHCRADDEDTADEHFIGRFELWLTDWRKSASRQSLESRAGGSRVRWHFVGRPFERPTIQRAVLAALQHLHPQWECTFASDPVSDVVKGAAEYIHRRSHGLPTWLDIVPDLYFVSGQQVIQLFRRRSVRPGEAVLEPPTQTFRLPPGQQAYLLPLVRDKDSRVPLAFEARLESERHFPLHEAVVVRAHVSYRHAVDGFQIRFVPNGESSFDSIEVTWARAGTRNPDSERTIDNSEPAYPPSLSWEDTKPDDIAAVKRTIEAFSRTCQSVFSSPNGLLVQQQQRTDHVIAEMIKCIEAAEDLDEGVREVWVSGREEIPNPRLGRLLQEKVFPWCAKLLRTNELGCATASMPRSFVKLSDLQLPLRAMLSRLRYDVPDVWLDAEFNHVQSLSNPSEKDFHRLGRLLDARRPKTCESAVEWLVTTMDGACSRPGWNRVKACAWCLALALFRRRGVVTSLTGAVCGRVLAACESLVSLLADDPQGIDAQRAEILTEACMVIFSLLRRRGMDDGPLYQAGSERMNRLAHAIEGAGRATPEQKTRYSVDGRSPATPAQVAALVCEALRGERVAVIEPYEEA